MAESFSDTDNPTFPALGLSQPITDSLDALGYEVPTPIQRETIPLMLAGRDLIGQAQTGTGKTASFVLPILERLDVGQSEVQGLILTPTREPAIQVAEAVHSYARGIPGVKEIPIYGGDSIQRQIKRLRGGIHLVVGTPGRVMDHLRKGTLDISALRFFVLDEADEMLRMGFIDDVEWILQQAPADRQTALFSATMPTQIRRIAENYLNDPARVRIEPTELTVPSIEQHYLHVPQRKKLDALTQLLEVETEPGEAVLIFARTKLGCAELVDRLQARGYAAEAMHGDMNQAQRESTIRRMRDGQVEIVTATDVAARGLDVDRISLVINYDMPSDVEIYVHRIGRTGRAGREGKAIMFVTPRETRMLRDVERYTKQRLTALRVPSAADVAAKRTSRLKERLLTSLEDDGLELYLSLVEDLVDDSGRGIAEVAAAALRMAQGDVSLEVDPGQEFRAPSPPPDWQQSHGGTTRLVLDVGRVNEVRPGDIVGAIANEAGIPGRAIGGIDIHDRETIVEVPTDQADHVIAKMNGVFIRSRAVSPRLAGPGDAPPRNTARRSGKGTKFNKKGRGTTKAKSKMKRR